VVLIERFLDGIEPEGFGYFAPDIVVEVLSPNESSQKLKEKIVEYFANGSKLVLVIDPKVRAVTVYRSPEKAETLRETQTLDCSLVLPGFACKVSEIFKKRSR
jgi:Uma2 family endonuclease